jgi:hypothetical protein
MGQGDTLKQEGTRLAYDVDKEMRKCKESG